MKQILKKFPSDKINSTKLPSFFFCELQLLPQRDIKVKEKSRILSNKIIQFSSESQKSFCLI